VNLNITEQIIEGRTCVVCLPPSYESSKKTYPVIYVQDGDVLQKNISAILGHTSIECIIIGIYPENRLDEYTPWKASELHRRFPPFGGQADSYLTFLTNTFKPAVDRMYRTNPAPSHTGLMGYSLGGLFSIYCAYTSVVFGICISISGSFWYKDWDSFLKTRKPPLDNLNIYLSSGTKEGSDAKDLKRNAIQNTKQTYIALKQYLGEKRVTLDWDEGGHHHNLIPRFQKAFAFISTHI
jgi:predicted alpha/beta superfamily hydrolase